MYTRRHFLGAFGSALAAGAGGMGTMDANARADLARIVLGFPPGGSNDAVARLVARKIQGGYASSVIVENRAGAGGRIGVEGVKRALPDGATILQTPGSIMTLYPHIYRSLSYDPLRDFIPVSNLCTLDFVLAVSADATPARTIGEYIDWCKKDARNATFGSPATGASPHFVGLMFGQAAGIQMLHVGYKGAAPAVQDLVGGQVPAYVGMLADVAAYLKSEKVRVLATSGSRRAAATPDVPTFSESGFKDVSLQEWYGMFVPAQTPKANVEALNAAVQQALRDPETVASFAKLTVEAAPTSSADFAERVQRETEVWGRVVQATGFKMMD